MNTDLTFKDIIRESSEKYSDKHAMSFIGEKGYSYSDVHRRSLALSAFLEKLGVRKNDKVALLGTNSPDWVISYFAVTSMGAVIVPVLPDFTKEEIYNILEHSEAHVLFISDSLYSAKQEYPESLQHIISIGDYSLLWTKGSDAEFSDGDIPLYEPDMLATDLAAIIYTSGTTGSSKGVMLSHRNIISNALMGKKLKKIVHTDRFLSILPLAHTLENTVGMIIPFISGSSIYYLSKIPTPSVLLPALKEVKPTIMLSVPLIIEKIYFNRIRPTLTCNAVIRNLYRMPLTRKILSRAAGKKLMETFGGELSFFGIGGAKLNAEVDRFLLEAKFPYAVGYGLTESSPLLAGMVSPLCKTGSTGPPVEGVEIKLDNVDHSTGEGEIWARGANIMQGYYKNPEKTAEVLTEDGWLRTGDLGCFDKSGYLFIRGRIKNVIVGASGENIYPEEIESIINTFKHVAESLVLEKGGKLVAMVHINREEIEEKYKHLKEEMTRAVEDKIQEIINELSLAVNSRLNRFSRIQQFELQPIPFQKTATKKIKRYLYS